MKFEEFKKAADISAGLATRWYPHIDAAMDEFGITKQLDRAMFIAQCGHESNSFVALVESLNYTPVALMKKFGRRVSNYQAAMLGRTAEHPAKQEAIANLVYAGRNGNKAVGDGWRYRGRGLIQVTGLGNYRECGSRLKLDLVSQPDLLAQDLHAARSAAWFYTSSGCIGRSGDIERITLIINGGRNGIADRRHRFEIAAGVLA